QHLTRLAACGRRDEALHLHHVDQARRTAEPDPQPPLQIRDRCLPALHDEPRNEIRDGRFALIRPVMTSTDGRCVARIRWMPTARAICASRAIDSSTS